MKLKISILIFAVAFLINLQATRGDLFRLDLIINTYNDIKNTFLNVASKFLDITRVDNILEDTIIKPQTYDFIIVGAGAAGSVLANRLTENPNWKVLLIEAGFKEILFTRIPIVTPALQFTPYNWGYFTQRQEGLFKGLNGEVMHWPKGRALGGSTVINNMVYTRGNKYDFEKWVALGNPGWSWEEVLPYYMKSEKTHLKELDPKYHGTSGYLSTENIYKSELVETFIEGGKELNLPHYDYNANVQPFGVSRAQATLLKGQRHTNARAFLEPIKHRKNLHIITKSIATKILIHPETNEAYGIEFYMWGLIKRHAYASKEVILSSGSISSPQLLMLSGIGPKNDLEKLKIKTLKDAPGVGQNLIDHLIFPGMAFLIDKDISLSPLKLISPKSIYDYLIKHTGPWTSLGGVEGIGYIKTNASEETEDIPDIELIMIGGSLTADGGLFSRVAMNIKNEVYNALFGNLNLRPNWSIFPLLIHPKSQGYLKLKSTNPFQYPLIYPNYFTDKDDHDMKTFLASLRFIQKMANTTAFQKLGSRLSRNKMPGCDHFEFDSDDYWICCMKGMSVTLYHYAGTAKMGPDSDPMAVVDSELRVYGVKNLRVIDASIFPVPLAAHTSAPTTMVAEKGADYIKKTWGDS